ncbi:MAG TPA: MerR family transcriptional regulator [Actinophytocola sp.]|uniref:MerR family transcriptional regulator n=1 Tax=Actinophytocola sp. TaxID=1872138 RepID=UPI002DDD6A36|nr:MerR family transcriptional regulator [Actinophytocola sp.]HEV2779661.1 MerR family transcriptional regulator [Actinophytocola sp.]
MPSDDEPLLSISVFGRRSRLSLKALRLYDRMGLLPPARVDQPSGYRWYRESQLETARLIAMLRRLDMPLARVGEVLSAPGPRAAELIAAYWDATERRVASQRELAAYLRYTLAGGQEPFGRYEFRVRDVGEQWVLAERRHVRVATLSVWIEATMGRLLAMAGDLGGVVGPAFVVYYGEVNEDSDGPGECCVPIDPAAALPADAPARVEPAHREAYVRLIRAQVEYPQILSAYDALAQWITRHGHTAAGAPREIYFADFRAAQPNDEVCDVAFPIR